MTRYVLKASRRTTVRIVLAAALLLAFVWEHLEATRLGYDVEQALRHEQEIKSRLVGTQMELETMLSPERLALEAHERLGLIPASPGAIRVLDPQKGGSVRGGFLASFFPVFRGRPQALLYRTAETVGTARSIGNYLSAR